ncbi:hypothetical protein [Bdellovibrio sp. HCB288]|uniref:hypothetical protein n=1 Tax=Bdellovibrio sp. HCB288 TaxID=3394355 RepID=UPI0039B45901
MAKIYGNLFGIPAIIASAFYSDLISKIVRSDGFTSGVFQGTCFDAVSVFVVAGTTTVVTSPVFFPAIIACTTSNARRKGGGCSERHY